VFENILSAAVKRGSKKYLTIDSGERINLARSSKVTGQNAKKYLFYVHVPFCEKLCPYCSFNRYEFEPLLAADYFVSLRRELEIYRDYGYDCDAVYIGGGTPTILLDELAKTIGLIRRLYSVREISLETNPNHLTRENLGLFKQLKINRLSVGVQSFNDQILKKIGRYDVYGSAAEIKERLKAALDDSYVLNVDMIFNFPFQTREMLERDIDCIIQLKPDQVTFYPLMPSGAFSRESVQVNHKKEKQFYFKILDKLSCAWEPLSVWCFGRKKGMIDEYIINRNEYIAIGSGSFGLLDAYIYANTFSPRQYIDKLRDGQLPVIFSRQFSKEELLRYGFLMQLFGTTLDIEKFNDKYSADFLKAMWKELVFLQAAGSIVRKNGKISLTRKGMYYWLVAMREFFIGVSNFRQHCHNLN